MEKPYVVTFNEKAIQSDWLKLDSAIKIRIKSAIQQKLQVNPRYFGIPLQNSLHGYFKLRVGNYRIIYKILHIEHVVSIEGIQHRSIVYKEMRKRI